MIDESTVNVSDTIIPFGISNQIAQLRLNELLLLQINLDIPHKHFHPDTDDGGGGICR